jgi:hypothetical protein
MVIVQGCVLHAQEDVKVPVRAVKVVVKMDVKLHVEMVVEGGAKVDASRHVKRSVSMNAK